MTFHRTLLVSALLCITVIFLGNHLKFLLYFAVRIKSLCLAFILSDIYGLVALAVLCLILLVLIRRRNWNPANRQETPIEDVTLFTSSDYFSFLAGNEELETTPVSPFARMEPRRFSPTWAKEIRHPVPDFDLWETMQGSFLNELPLHNEQWAQKILEYVLRNKNHPPIDDWSDFVTIIIQNEQAQSLEGWTLYRAHFSEIMVLADNDQGKRSFLALS